MQKVCVWIYQKGKRTQPLKNAQINQNEQTQIDATGRFYSQNKQALTRAKKSTKNLTITTKQVTVAKRMYVKSPDHSNKQNMVREIAENQEGTTRKTCNRQKVQKWGIGPEKSDKQCTKVLQKIRRQQNCTCNDKNQNTKQITQQAIAPDTSKTRQKIQQFRQAQKQRHSLGDCFVKKSK